LRRKFGPKTPARQTIDDVVSKRDAASGRQRGGDQSQKATTAIMIRTFTRDDPAPDSEEASGKPRQIPSARPKVVKQVVERPARHAMNQRHAFSKQRNLVASPSSGPGKVRKLIDSAAEPRRESLNESKAALLWRNGGAHWRSCAAHDAVRSWATTRKNQSDAAERAKIGCTPTARIYINEQQRAEHEASARPGDGAPAAKACDRGRIGRFDRA